MGRSSSNSSSSNSSTFNSKRTSNSNVVGICTSSMSSSEGGGQHPFEGYIWRKYGEKTVSVHKQPVKRCYYRCICAMTHAPCPAKKHVDRPFGGDPGGPPQDVVFLGEHLHVGKGHVATAGQSNSEPLEVGGGMGAGYAQSYLVGVKRKAEGEAKLMLAAKRERTPLPLPPFPSPERQTTSVSPLVHLAADVLSEMDEEVTAKEVACAMYTDLVSHLSACDNKQKVELSLQQWAETSSVEEGGDGRSNEDEEEMNMSLKMLQHGMSAEGEVDYLMHALFGHIIPQGRSHKDMVAEEGCDAVTEMKARRDWGLQASVLCEGKEERGGKGDEESDGDVTTLDCWNTSGMHGLVEEDEVLLDLLEKAPIPPTLIE